MKRPEKERDILTDRQAAAAVVFFVSGPIFFLIWFRLAAGGDGSGYPFGLSWHAPLAATMVCTVAAYFLPEKMVEFAGRLIGLLFYGP